MVVVVLVVQERLDLSQLAGAAPRGSSAENKKNELCTFTNRFCGANI